MIFRLKIHGFDCLHIEPDWLNYSNVYQQFPAIPISMKRCIQTYVKKYNHLKINYMEQVTTF